MKPIDIHPDSRGQTRNGQRSLGLNAVVMEFESRGAGIEIKLKHGLGRVPVGAFPMGHLGTVAFEPYGSTTPYECSAWDSECCYFLPMTVTRTMHRFLVF